MSLTVGPYRIVKAGSNNIALDKNVFYGTVSNDRAMHVPVSTMKRKPDPEGINTQGLEDADRHDRTRNIYIEGPVEP